MLLWLKKVKVGCLSVLVCAPLSLESVFLGNLVCCVAVLQRNICDSQEMMQIFAASCSRSLWMRCVLCQRPPCLMREPFHLCGLKLLREPPSFWGSPVIIKEFHAFGLRIVTNRLGWFFVMLSFQWHTWKWQHQRQHSSSRPAPCPGHPPGARGTEGNSEVRTPNPLCPHLFSTSFFTIVVCPFICPVSWCRLFFCCCAFGNVAPARWTTNAPPREPAPPCCPFCSAFRTYTAARRSPLLKRKPRWLSFTEQC